MLETSRLILTPPTPGHAGAMAGYVQSNRSHLGPWEPVRPEVYFTPDHWRAQFAGVEAEMANGNAVRLVMVPKDAPQTICGTINFSQIFRGPFLACYVGYGIAGDRQGQGLMAEGLRAAIGHMFGTLGLHRIMANYVPANERSGRVLRALGFQVEGYARDYLYINGAWRDHILAALTNPDPVVP